VIDSARLVADLKKQLKLLEADLRERADDPETPWAQGLKQEYERAFSRERTARTWSEWSAGELSQAAVAWLVAATFIRFCEDNDLLSGASVDGASSPAPWIAGPGDRLDRAVEHQTYFFRANPTLTARDWLVQPFKALSALPAGRGLLDPEHSPVWSITISASATELLLDFWRATNPDGSLVHDFTDPVLGTRFLGDIYQDLSDYAQKTYALLQTPIFVEEFILDRTLTPAIAEFGLDGLKLIDPTCGSGHFLLGAFDRLVEAWAAKAPAMDARTRVQTALNSIHGVDLNPFAVAIARFRLTVAALLASGERSLVSAPAFAFKLAVGDSLLRWKADDVTLDLGDQEETFAYSTEDIREYAGILDTNQYHVVVGNPPYIQVKDKALNEAYRRLYSTCKGKYALSVPFMELFFELALRATETNPAGYVGKITSNSFMKREFGSKLIEDFLSGHQEFTNPVDLTHVIDTSVAFIPGHNTPTVILFGRRRRKQGETLRAALGVRGEPGEPADPTNGLAWRDIVDHLDEPGYGGIYVTIADVPRESFRSHPWSLSGGGAEQLKRVIEGAASSRVREKIESAGISAFTLEDDVYVRTSSNLRRVGVQKRRPMVLGENLRDWCYVGDQEAIFPYDDELQPVKYEDFPEFRRALWPFRTNLSNSQMFGRQSKIDAGLKWTEYGRLTKSKFRSPLSIVFAAVSTHNHFTLDRGGKLFKQTAPILKLAPGSSEAEHFELLAVLNSSVTGFWLKQVSYPKGGDPVGSSGARVSAEAWSDRYDFNATNVEEVPLPAGSSVRIAKRIDDVAQNFLMLSPSVRLAHLDSNWGNLDGLMRDWRRALGQLVFLQEELDWEVYRRFGLVDEGFTIDSDDLEIMPNERAFEISLARMTSRGDVSSSWFSRHERQMVTEIPAQWPETYRELVQRRLDLIESDPMIRLLEQPEYKRRWATPSWESQLRDALTTFILDRMEARELWMDVNGRPVTRSLAQLAEALKSDDDLRSALVMLTGDPSVNIQSAIASLIAEEAVPAAAPQRYKPSGLTKFREWQAVWELQRAEDRGEKVTIPVPPKYAPADFAKASYWKARGKLDVPKERFIAYPGARRATDDTSVYGWAGWTHAEQGVAASTLLVEMASAGATVEQLMPLFAALIEVEPWIHQWHADVDPVAGVSPAAAVTGVIENQLARAQITRDDVAAWRPAAATRGRRPAALKAKTVEDTP